MNALLRKILASVVLVGILVLVNDLAARLPVQVDLTKERFFTLSDASLQMLARIQKPVLVELYFSSSRKGLPIGLKVFAQRVEQLLRQYERRSAGKVSVRVLDPAPGSREEEEARRLGLAAQPLGPDEQLYFGLAVFHGGNRRTIPLVDYRRERLMEYDISRLIQAVQVHRLPRMTVATSLEVFGDRGMPKEMQKVEDGTAEWQFIKELRISYELQEITPNWETLPANTDVLLVINPSGFTPGLVRAIDQFILSGRPALILVDPFCYHEVERDDRDGPVIGEEYFKSSDLPQLFSAWGLRFSAGQAVGDLGYPTDVPVQANQPPISFPLWLSITNFDDTQPVTAGFDTVLLPQPGFLELSESSQARLTPLLRSSTRSAPLPASGMAKLNPYRAADSIHPTGESYVLAALVEGHFRTAFPERRPGAVPAQRDSQTPDPWDLGLKESSDLSRVIVVADADFVADPVAYMAVSRPGGNLVTRPRNNNIALLINSLDFLRGSHGMLPISAKGQTIRPFTRLHQMRREADERFRQEVQDINARLEQSEGELVELNRQAAQGGSKLISEKALTAIRRVQKEQNGLRARRTQIQQRLQEAIGGLQQRLTLLNLGVVPGLVALGGIVFWQYRTRRKGQA